MPVSWNSCKFVEQIKKWNIKMNDITPQHRIWRAALALCFMSLLAVTVHAQQWPKPSREAKPYTRWWWHGSAVDSAGINYCMTEYAKAGIGGVEITPIYGVQHGEDRELSYLSPQWMKMLRYVEDRAKQLNMGVDMATGTGWPFGGPLVSEDDAACRLIFDADDNHVVGHTKQMVKRAAPGGEGLVIDHFSKEAVAHYLARFDTAFANQRMSFPNVMFNDSYEVYGADWTPNFYSEFMKRRGYDFEPYTYIINKKDSLRTDADHRIISDYRETLGELLLENFTTQWTDWAHAHGSVTRNQAHGSPANLLDIYAAVDIPECEGFGLSDFGIKGLRKDPGFTKKNDSDISMLKYASSAAHISGKPLVSSETFTWLTEHFRTSLSQCKPDLDLMFLSGVNHVVFHGSCYSPSDEPWPGRRFYASVDMSPANNWWSAMPAFSRYIERCQSFLQMGKPDNDILVYLPYYDMIYDQPGSVALFDIHSMAKRAPKFIKAVQSIIGNGYEVDYISDRYLQQDSVVVNYSAIVVPDVRFMPLATLRRLVTIAEQGGHVVFVNSLPQSVPGYGRDKEQKEFNALIKRLNKTVSFHPEQAMMIKWGTGSIITTPSYGDGLQYTFAKQEAMRLKYGLSCIRRRSSEGYHYFISNLQGKDIDAYVEFGAPFHTAVLYNPMTGEVGKAKVDSQERVRLQLKSGESIIVRTYNYDDADKASALPAYRYYDALDYRATVLKQWTLRFKDAAPVAIDKTYSMTEGAKAWTNLGDSILNATMATGVYSTSFDMPNIPSNAAFILDLGDVRETARVLVNGKDAGTLFAVPYRIDITRFLKTGRNTLDIEVANLPANRIAQMDRDGVEWRRFKEINVVDLNYKKNHYDKWDVVPSGLNSDVKLIPCTIIE